MAGWKGTLRKKKALRIEERLEEFCSNPHSLSEVTEVIECQPMWQRYTEVANDIRQGKEVSPNSANCCMVAVAALLLYPSWQRPSAVENCTLEEFHARKLRMHSDGSQVTVICVKKHKTAEGGSAKLTASKDNLDKVLVYVECYSSIS